jgi:hypothetical protein
MCELLAKIPLFCTHYLDVIQKEGESSANAISAIPRS